jgi:hypothetical protein
MSDKRTTWLYCWAILIQRRTSVAEDNVRHGLDDNPSGDAEKGATLGGVGGLVTGAVAGSAAGPGGAIIGAIVGGIAGAVASGVAVAAVDKHDNDNTVTGIGSDNREEWDYHDNDWREHYNQKYSSTGRPYDNNYQHAYRFGHDLSRHQDYLGRSWDEVEMDARRDWEQSNPGTWDTYRQPIYDSWDRSRSMTAVDPNASTGTSSYAYADAPGIQTGGHNADGSPDTRGITEKVADTVTGDKIDDKTGKRID